MTWPPDLRNCFERYWPVLNSKSLFDDLGIDEITQDPSESPSLLSENRSGKDQFLVENSNRGKEEDLEDFSQKRTDGEEIVDLQSEGLAKCVSSGRDNKQERKPGHRGGVNENLPSQNDLYRKHMPKPLQNHVMATAQDV
ncbi:hypothetical protein L3X38_023328 [Prunus dulcis]|uniref:Uncharacterized protein n=1 Tax=Prunus dulcis TaxID=3755 RepID=A0AAD4VXS1_PRUDU|nr:hypothetical protein L3X38_023328 [Prunus dulcis]